MERVVNPLFVCYVSGLDLRRIRQHTMPFLSAELEGSPWRSFINLPSNELFPTLVTGVDPMVHGVWGVKVHEDIEARLKPCFIDKLPDFFITSLQCGLQLTTGRFDLAAIPPRRRRRFQITRTKYKRRRSRPDALYQIGSVPTVLGLVGPRRSRYWFSSDRDPEKRVLAGLGSKDLAFEILELYSLDRYQQWNLNDEHRVGQFYGIVDGFLKQLKVKCERAGKSLVVLTDHGHEKITRSIDINDALRMLPLSENDYSHFVEVSSARFWFHSQRAREMILSTIRNISNAAVISWQDMAAHGVPLPDDSYGEMFCFLPPGSIFFPHDFYQPLANLYMGLTDSMQRSRLRDPRHRGNHGHLPHFDAETSFMLVSNPAFRRADEDDATVLDVAPSLLSLLGIPVPEFMSGRALFECQ